MLIISNTTSNKGNYTAQIEAFSGNYSPISISESESQQTIVEDFTQPVILEAEEITGISANGITYTPAADPESPQNGEYLWNPYSKELQIFAEKLPRSIQVSSPLPTIPVIPPLLSEPHPLLFKNLPLEGAIQLNRSFENHPSIMKINTIDTYIDFFRFQDVYLDDISRAINNLDKSKACQENYIPTKIIKENCDIFAEHLLADFNRSVIIIPFLIY